MIRSARALALVLLALLLVACMGRDGVLPKAALTSITPTSGTVTDGTRVTLSGSNFHQLAGSDPGQPNSLSVEVCGVPLEQLELVVESQRTVMLPPASSVRVQIGDELSGVIGAGATGGPSDVTVNLPGGQQLVLPAAFDCLVPAVSASISTDAVSGSSPLTVTFDGSGSTSVTGVISEYWWDFGDGATATGVTVSHTFTRVGTYQVILVVSDDTGASDEATIEIEVVNSAPVAAIAVEQASGTASAPVTVTFDAGASSDADGDALTYSWTIDGAPAGTETTTSHTFSRSGTYEVSLSVTDSRGATSSSSLDYAVGNSAPVAVFSTTPDPARGNGPLLLTFDASDSSDADGTINSFEWDFGDGATGNGETVSHSFVSGTYIVTLTVEDDEGQKSTATGQVLVDNSPPVAEFTASLDPATGPAPLTVQFDAGGSVDPDGSIVSYEWEFGTSGTGVGVSPEHTFLRSGDQTVRLTVRDNEGAIDTAELLVQVTNAPPVAAASVTAVNGYQVSFSAADSYDPDGDLIDYTWTMGDGTSLSGETISHTYARSGDYGVTLTVTDDEGAHSDVQLPLQLSNTPPVAVPEIVETVGYEVTFSASGSYDPDGDPLTYSWDAGDGSSPVAVETFTHTYSRSGDYTVTLTVTDSESGDHAAQVTASPVNIAPTAIAITDPSPASGFAPLAVHLMAIPDSFDQPGGGIVSYEWELDGGVISDNPDYDHTFTTVGAHQVTLTVTDNEGATGSVTVAVEALASEVQSVLINEGDQNLLGGEVAPLTARVEGIGNISQSVTWQSSDPNVASVSEAGAVTAIADGTATITATSVQDTSVSDSVQVSVLVPLGTALDERIQAMAVDGDDNIYLTGYVNTTQSSDILLMKLDPQGRLLWRETYGTQHSDAARSIALDPLDNSIILAGDTNGDLETGAVGGSHDLFVMKISADDRSIVWTYQYGGAGWDGANDVIVDGNGDIYFTGAFNRDVDTANCPADCGRIIVGRADSTGTSVEVSLHGDRNGGTGEVITLDNHGNIVVAGHSSGVFGETIGDRQGAYLMQVNPDDLNERTRLVFVDTFAVDFVDALHVAQDGSIIWVGRDNTVDQQLARTVVRVFNAADYTERLARWFQYYHAAVDSVLDREGYLVIGAGVSEGIELSRLDPGDLRTVASEQILRPPPTPELPNPQLWGAGVGEQSDGTLVLAGYGYTDYFEPNQGGFDPFVWITDPW